MNGELMKVVLGQTARFIAPELWIAYLDCDGRQIGPRESVEGTTIDHLNRVTLPSVPQDKIGVCSIEIV
jgi:hypothetical protein